MLYLSFFAEYSQAVLTKYKIIMIDHLETNNLFQLIESWNEENIDLAIILVKNN